MKTDKKQNQYRVNEQIRVREVRIVGESGSTVMPTRQALDMAHQQGVDLVEISPNANPPVCRLIDYSKFLYQQKKRAKEMKAKQVKVEVKEIRFGPQTDEHDYQFKLKHAKEFLEEGNKVRAYVFFRGRSILFKEQGEVLLLRFANDLEEFGKVESMPSLEGKKMFLYLAPKKAGVAKKSQQARDRERLRVGDDELGMEAEAKESQKQANMMEQDIDIETPANGGLFANAKISADALKKLQEQQEDED
jgi:translation initiation factor IF-3